jgi:peptide/nickel transport system ATP-binding protein
MNEPLLSVQGLSVDFPTEDGVVHAVRGVSFDLEPRQVLGIVGESGCGKSVTNMAIMGLLPNTAQVTGSVRLRGTELIGMRPKELRKICGKRIAMIFQDPMTSLNPVYTVGWQISEAIMNHNEVSKDESWRRAVDLLDMVGIPQAKDRVKAYPHEFSGGMRQRAMIAMALANDPEVIVADEPTTALDVTVQAQILELLVRLKDETSAAIILITHDLGVVAGMADRTLVMYAGRVVEEGPVEDVYYRPRMPYTAGLLGAIPSLESEGERLNQIQGAPPSLVNLPPGCPFSPRCPIAEARCLEVEPGLVEVGTDHHAACLRTDVLAAVPDPRTLFLTGSHG